MKKLETKVVAVEVPNLPPEVSGDGKRNAFHVSCEVMGHCRPYAACLHLCDERKAGRLDIAYADCSVAIGKKRCPALAMRAEETSTGKAIYFIERHRSIGEVIYGAAQELVRSAVAAVTQPVKSKASSTSSVTDMIDAGDYSTAINVEMKKTGTPAAPVVLVAAVAPIAGESLLDMAKRMMAQPQPH